MMTKLSGRNNECLEIP